MDILKAELLLKINAKLGEGSIWDKHNNLLYWVDIEGKYVYKYNYFERTNTGYQLMARPGTVVPYEGSSVLIATEKGIGIFDFSIPDFKEYIIKTPDFIQNNLRFNDGKCDSKGRFWVGTMHLKAKKDAGSLYLLNNIKLETKVNRTTISNGLAWSHDNLTMYYIDTTSSCVLAFDYDIETGSISNERVAIEINPELGYPDGMTMDAEGMLWIALWDGYAVARFNPISGKLLTKVEVPAPKVTSCAFGGEDLQTLFITTARVDMNEEDLEKYPLSGSLFHVKPGVKGNVSNKFVKS